MMKIFSKISYLIWTSSVAFSMEATDIQDIQESQQNSNQLVRLNTQFSNPEDLGDMQLLDADVLSHILIQPTFNWNQQNYLRLVCKSFNWHVSKYRTSELTRILNNQPTLDPFSLSNEVFIFDKFEDSRLAGQISGYHQTRPLDFFLESVREAIELNSILLKRSATRIDSVTRHTSGYVFSVNTWRGTVPNFETTFIPKDIVQFGRTYTDYGPSGNFTCLLTMSIKNI